MADRKSWREEKSRSRRHEDREREGSLLFSSPLKPITVHAPACFNSFEERKQRVGRLRPRKGGALDSLVKNPLDWISRSRTAQSPEMNCKKHSLMGDGTKVRKLSG